MCVCSSDFEYPIALDIDTGSYQRATVEEQQDETRVLLTPMMHNPNGRKPESVKKTLRNAGIRPLRTASNFYRK